MIPEADVEVSCDIPPGTEFWVPDDEDVAEDEGLSMFRDVWLIYNYPLAHARSILSTECELLSVADQYSSNDREFEEVAICLEKPSDDERDIPEDVRDRIPRDVIEEHFLSDFSPLEGLDLGISGLVHALSAAGLMTAASCRGHASKTTWSTYPVVFFASDREHMELLLPIVRSTGCGLGVNGILFYIYGRSIVQISDLASVLIEQNSIFGTPVFRWKAERQAAALAQEIGPNQPALPGFDLDGGQPRSSGDYWDYPSPRIDDK